MSTFGFCCVAALAMGGAFMFDTYIEEDVWAYLGCALLAWSFAAALAIEEVRA